MTKLNRCKNFLAVSLWALKLKQLAPLFCRRSHVTGMTRVTYAEDVLPEKTHGTQHCNTSPGSWPCHCHEDRFAEILESCQCNQKRSLAKLHRGVGFLQSSLHAEITRKTAFSISSELTSTNAFLRQSSIHSILTRNRRPLHVSLASGSLRQGQGWQGTTQTAGCCLGCLTMLPVVGTVSGK